jgi:hypothetical protein
VTSGSRPRWNAYLSALTLAVLLTLVPTYAALAAWPAQASGSGAGAAAVTPSGTAPAGSASGTSVTISWAAAKFANGAAVAGYQISRYNAGTGAPATVGTGCSGVITTTTCTEQAVPAGTWVYADTPAQLTWTGGPSPHSTQIVVS